MCAQWDSTNDSGNLNGSLFWESISQVLWNEVSTFHILVRGCSVEGQQEHKISGWTNSISSQVPVPFPVGYCYAENIWYLKEGDFKITHLLPIPLQSKESKSIWKYSLVIYFSSYAKEKSAYFSLYSLISIYMARIPRLWFPWGSLHTGLDGMRTGQNRVHIPSQDICQSVPAATLGTYVQSKHLSVSMTITKCDSKSWG